MGENDNLLPESPILEVEQESFRPDEPNMETSQEDEIIAAPGVPLVGLYAPKKIAYTFSGDATRALALARPLGVIDEKAQNMRIGNVTITSGLENLTKLGGGELKLLKLGIGAFTEANSKGEKNLKLRVYADTKEYARACIKDPSKGIDPQPKATPEEQEKENKRAKKALKNFLVKLAKNASNLGKNTFFTWEEKIQGKKETFSGLSFLGGFDIDRDVITLDFTLRAAEYLIKLPLDNSPRSFFAIDDRNPNALSMAQQLCRRYSIDKNVLRDTERIIKVETLLSYTSLPKYDPLDRYRSRWDSRIKEPFENALEEMKSAGFLADWYYCKSGKIPLSDKEAQNINRYEQFSALYIYFELADFDSHEERLKAVADRKEKKIEAAKIRKKAAENRKKKTGDGAEE